MSAPRETHALGLIGLGTMGANFARNLARHRVRLALFDTEAAAWEWAHYTFPAALYTSGTLSLYVTDKKHCDIANAVIQSPLNIVPMGVSVDVDFLFQGGALSFVTDP
jgi:lactate dehydrogenase-like 2-hydroxyacid dehydrogenase